MKKDQEFLTINEAANLLKVSKTSLRRWSNEGRLTCYRIGMRRERRFLLKDLMVLMGSDEPQEPSLRQRHLAPRAEAGVIKHICTHFTDQDEQWRLLRDHLLEHVRPGTQTVYIHNGDKQHVISRLAAAGFDTAKLLDDQTLRLIASEDSYLRNDCFDTERMLDFWSEVVDNARRQNIKKLLLTGEMRWIAANLPGCEQLLAYELKLEEFLQRFPWVTVVCQYSLSHMTAPLLYESLHIHSLVQLPECLTIGLHTR